MIFLIIPVLAIALYPVLRYNCQSALSMAQAVRCFGKRKLRFCRAAEFSGAFGFCSSALCANRICFFARCGAEGLDSAGNLKFLRGSQSLHRAAGSCFGHWPRSPLALCASPSFKTMRPCQLVRASREHCAHLCAATGRHGLGATLGGAALGKSRQPPRPLGLPFCAMRCRLRLDVPPVRLRLDSLPCAKMLRRSGASLAVISPPPRQEPEVPETCWYLLKTMQPCQLVRASREHCAFLYAATGRMS